MYSNVTNVKEQQNVLAEAQKHYDETYGKKEKPFDLKQDYTDKISAINDVNKLEELKQEILKDVDADEFSEEMYDIIDKKIENIENQKNIVTFDNKQYTIGSFVRIKGEGDKLYEVTGVDNNRLKVQFLGGKTTRNVSDPKDIMSTLTEEEGKKEISKKAKEKAKEKATETEKTTTKTEEDIIQTEEEMKEEKKESEDTLNISTENKNETLKDKEFIEESIKLSENKSPEDILKELEKSNKEKC